MRLAERLHQALFQHHPLPPILLTGDDRDHGPPADEGLAAAAVLVGITDRADPGVLLTQRPAHLRRHPGQIAFPGGRIDPDDADAIAAALREAEEEIALPRAAVEIVGIADRYRTVTGFEVTPVIGVVAPDQPLIAAPGEVDDVFEVPFSFLMDETNHVEASVEWQGLQRRYYEIIWNDRRIWGATAAMIVNLARRLRWQN